jgi:hypothetical protein
MVRLAVGVWFVVTGLSPAAGQAQDVVSPSEAAACIGKEKSFAVTLPVSGRGVMTFRLH